MRTKAALALLAITLIAGGSAFFLNAREQPVRRPYPKATPPPPPSPIYEPSNEKVPTEEEIELALAMHEDLLLGKVARALETRDPQERETAFALLLPELLQVAPERVVELFDRQKGEPRDALRAEIASQWVTQDRDAAMRWMESLEPAERQAAAYDAVRALAPVAPDQAIHVADAFGIGRDDGFIDKLMLVWASDNIHQVERWMATLPEGPRTDALRTTLERARRQIRDRG
jgi:hypothetical protein